MQPDTFRAVPFDPEWVSHDKIDLHAIYRRPILDDVGEQVIDEHGVPKWDLTGGLPVRRHFDYLKKGFEYVTLADAASLGNKIVMQRLRAVGLEPREFIMLRNRVVGATPWNPQLYLAQQARVDREGASELRALVEQLGSAAVLAVMRTQNPAYELPVHLRNIPPGGRVVLPGAPATAAVTSAPAPGPGRRIKLGSEAGDEILVCSKCAGALPANAYSSPELPEAVFCSDACLKALLPRVSKNSLAGRERKRAAKARGRRA